MRQKRRGLRLGQLKINVGRVTAGRPFQPAGLGTRRVNRYFVIGDCVKPYIIPIFIAHRGCPHQCVFCDQRKITGVKSDLGAVEIAAIIGDHLAKMAKRREVEVAFYGGSFTALPGAAQEELLTPAKSALDRGKIHRIRVSTRPDAIDEKAVRRLIDYGVST